MKGFVTVEAGRWQTKTNYIAFINKQGKLTVHVTSSHNGMIHQDLNIFNVINGEWKSIESTKDKCQIINKSDEAWTLKDSFVSEGLNEKTFFKIDVSPSIRGITKFSM